MTTPRPLFVLVAFVMICTVFYLMIESNDQMLQKIISAPTEFRSWPSDGQNFSSDLDVTERLASEHVEFLMSATVRRHLLFVIEPSVLVQLMDKEEVTALRKNQLIPENAFSFDANSLAMGQLPENFLKDICSSVSSDEKLSGFTCSSFAVSSPFHGNDFNEKRTLISAPISHYIMTKNGKSVQIAVFHRRDNFLWMEKMPKEMVTKFDSILTFGLNSRELYDKFEVVQNVLAHEGQEIPILVPHQLWYFLSQIETSSFVSCDFEAARQWQGGQPSKEFKDIGLRGFRSMKRLTKELRIQFWLASGTLLGWYRQCDVIPYTTDFDFATWAKFADVDFKSKVQNVLNSSSGGRLRLYCTYGFPEEAYEMTFSQEHTHFDLFFTYVKGDNCTYGGHIVPQRKYFDYLYPKWTLCSTIFLGEKVLVPCNSLEVIKAEYGLNWRTPVNNWHWANSPYNVGPMKTWPEYMKDFYWSSY